MTFRIGITRRVKADREFVFDWWTDLSSEDSKLVTPLKSRRIISKSADVVLLEDEEELYFRKMKFNVRVTMDRPNSWTAEYDGKAARARSEYNLTPEPDGTTTLDYHSMIEPKGFFTNLFSPLIAPFVKHVFAGEMDIFNQTLEREYQEKMHEIK